MKVDVTQLTYFQLEELVQALPFQILNLSRRGPRVTLEYAGTV